MITARDPSLAGDTQATAGLTRRAFLQEMGALLAAGAALPYASRLGLGVRRPTGGPFPERPNLLIIVTDQERSPMHWPAGWADANLSSSQRLRENGLVFTHAFCSAAMSSPSRASLFTGLFPPQHGVLYTLTEGGPLSPQEPTLPPPARLPNLATILKTAGYNVQYRGKWHMSKGPYAAGSNTSDPLTPADLAAYGFDGWIAPDVDDSTASSGFGGGCANHDGECASQAVAFLNSGDAKNKPWALVVSFVNPHDLLAYPRTWNHVEPGGCNNYGSARSDPVNGDCFAQGISLPPTYTEDLQSNYKPTAQGQTLSYLAAQLGAIELAGAAAANDEVGRADYYVNFYAYLQKVVDRHITDVLNALDDNGLTGDTVVIRVSDHGEMGLSHQGLRQALFNAYEESIHIPLIISNPLLFPTALQTDALASLVDLVPTLARMAKAPNFAGYLFAGKDLTPLFTAPSSTVQDSVLFTSDDVNGGSANTQTAVQPPNHVRCVRTSRYKYALYFDPGSAAAEEQELYDLQTDPYEEHNLADPANTAYYNPIVTSAMRDLLNTRMDEVRMPPVYHSFVPLVSAD